MMGEPGTAAGLGRLHDPVKNRKICSLHKLFAWRIIFGHCVIESLHLCGVVVSLSTLKGSVDAESTERS